MTNESHEEKPSVGAVARDWWKSLRPETGTQRRKGNPGALARLRRADLPAAALEEVTADLHRRLAAVSPLRREALFERAALIAAVLAHAREDESRKLAAAAGEKAGDQFVLHPLRLRRLFAARSAPDCLVAFRRLVAVLRGKANVVDLAESLLDWPDEDRGDQRRTRWAFDYYGAGAAAPKERGEQQDQAVA